MSKNNVYRDKQRQTKICSTRKKEGAKDAEQKQRKTYKGICKKGGNTRHRAEQKKKKRKNKGAVQWLVVYSKKMKEHKGC